VLPDDQAERIAADLAGADRTTLARELLDDRRARTPPDRHMVEPQSSPPVSATEAHLSP
jgi:hypothetical protein